MIQFNFEWSEPINILMLILAISLLPMQLWLLVFKNKQFFTGRLAIRLTLNILLWIAVMAYLFQPYIKKDSAPITGLIIGKDVPAAFAKGLTDRLKTAEILDFPSFERGHLALESLGNVDTLVLAGQDFTPDLFGRLMQTEANPVIKWISYFTPDQPQNLTWKGILRKGEMQRISGNLESSKKQVLKVSYANQTLDSTLLKKGFNSFNLNFPVFIQGRTAAELILEGKSLHTIRFFARPAAPLTFQFLLDNPDFESKNLATWLGKNGHSVLYNTTLSKDVQSKLTINKTKDPDILITGSGNASSTLVKKILANGKSVLFTGLTNPALEISAINAALGTKFQMRKVSDKTAVNLSTELTALPYNFIPSNHYFSVPGYPVAIEKTTGKIGVSLLNETYPLMLTGDSASYQKVWNSVLASVHPATLRNLEIPAPVYKGLKTTINLNNSTYFPELLKMGNDTIFLDYSAINKRSASASFTPLKPGWVSLSDSLETELFVESDDNSNGTFNTTGMKDFVKSYTSYQKKLDETADTSNDSFKKGATKRISDWVWFGLIIVCLAGVWVEGKL